MDAKYDYLANYLNEVGIDMVVPAEVKSEEVIFDANLSALIALLGKYAMENIFGYLDDRGCLIKYYVFLI